MSTENLVMAKCEQGQVEGFADGSVMCFRGIPYATNAGRFKPCLKPEPFDGIFDATKAAPVFPQPIPPTSILGIADEERYQSEDAFNLNIFTANVDASLPVIFFIHGGGWTSGSCQAPQYDGRELARTGRCVFVGMNYRLSCLGAIAPQGELGGNLAMRDIIAAFEWVERNIASFGGDPSKITIVGQSAGAAYVVQMLGMRELAGRIYRAGIFSVPGDADFMPIEKATELRDSLLAKAGVSSLEELSTIPLDKLMAAQLASDDPNALPPMMVPIYEEGFLDWNYMDGAIETSGSSVPILIGNDAHEASFFLPPEMCEQDNWWDIVAEISKMFFDACDLLSNGFAKQGGEVYRFMFERPCSIARFGSCHCNELPYFFNNLSMWSKAPLTRKFDAAEFKQLADEFSGDFIDFANGGSPWSCECKSFK